LKPNLYPLLKICAAFCLVILFLSSCKKDPYEIGKDLLPGSDTLTIGSSDSTSIIAYSELQDSIRTDKTATFILGSLADPVFGVSTASFYSQFRPASNTYDFGTNPVLDSVVLQLEYSSVYGDTNALQTVKVYEVSEELNSDKAYYSNHTATVYPTMLAVKTFRPAINDSVFLGTDTVPVAPHLRINLNQFTNYFGNKIISAPPTVLHTTSSFIEFMRGLYIESSKTNIGGALVVFKPLGTQTKVVVYYHNDDENGDALKVDLGIAALSGRFTHIDHYNYVDAGSDFRQQVLNHDTSLGKNMLFLQGLGGVRIKVRMPFLPELSTKLGTVSVNNAQLILKNITADTTLAPPTGLALQKIDSAGYTSFLVDENEGSEYFGGSYNVSSRTYSFRITRYVQSILLGKTKNKDLYITVNNPIRSLLNANRVVLTGTSPQLPSLSADRLQFRMIYTKAK
jgi:hypothetical protein